jgi:hypothetical protein
VTMATIAQGIQAGNLANGLNALAAFVQALQAATIAGQQITQISVTCVGLTNIQFYPPSALSVADSATLLNELITLSNALSAEWTAALANL